MILFKAEHVLPILDGRKTQTRRIGKKRWNVSSIHQAKTGFKKDDVFAELLILRVRKERLDDITEADARAEGYNSIEDYKRAFERIYGEWVPDEDVWVVDFERVNEREEQKMETTNVIKVRFGEQGKEYVYFTPEPVEVGDLVEIRGIDQMFTAVVTQVNVPAEEIAAFANHAKSIVRKVVS